MLKEEHKLRKAANSLILVLTINEQMKQTLECFEALLSVSDYEQRFFDDPSSMSAYICAKEAIISSIEQFKKTYGSVAIAEAYDAFKGAISEDEFCTATGIKQRLTKTGAATLFHKVFQELAKQCGSFPEETDGYAVFVELLRQAMHPGEETKQADDVCPYCSGIPTRVAKAEFFGDMVDDAEGFVWGCECGAYAQLASDGTVIGQMADRALHGSRKRIRHVILELSSLVGVTIFEGCKWVSCLTGRNITTFQDVEWLTEIECEKVLCAFDSVRLRLKSVAPEYPKSHKELFVFLEDGGRFSAMNAYGYKSGRLFVPIKVGDDAVRVRFRKGVQDIMLPKDLHYQFEGQQFVLVHPTGKKERFRLYAKEQRDVLYTESNQDTPNEGCVAVSSGI